LHNKLLAGSKFKIFFAAEYEPWRNAGPNAFQLLTLLKTK